MMLERVAYWLVFAAALGAAPAAAQPPSFPAAGELNVSAVSVHAQPDPATKVIRTIRQFRTDHEFQTVLALAARWGPDNRWWYELSLPGRPNGQRGWVQARLLDLHPMSNRIVIRRGARTLEVRRISTGKLLLRAVIAIGKPSSPTPLGRDFYVTGGFVPSDPFYGTYALATSAYSSLTEWPGGGIAGIHGTDQPSLLGQAVSHGCIRVDDQVALRLKTLAPPGTPIDMLP